MPSAMTKIDVIQKNNPIGAKVLHGLGECQTSGAHQRNKIPHPGV